MKSAYKEVIINKYAFISVLHFLTLLGSFRVGFGVGHISNMMEHKRLGTDIWILNHRNKFL